MLISTEINIAHQQAAEREEIDPVGVGYTTVARKETLNFVNANSEKE